MEQDFSEFCEWLSTRVHQPSRLGYVEMLLADNGGDDGAAFDAFWGWLDKFHKDNDSRAGDAAALLH